jgi:two-component system response regulator RegA
VSTPNEDTPRTILLVDDEELFRSRLARALHDRGYSVTEAESGTRALEVARAESPELCVVDLRMPGMSGLDVVRELHALDPTTRIVVLTGYGSIATALEAVRLGAVHYLTKPASLTEILAALEHGPEPSSGQREVLEVPSLARVEWEHIERVVVACGGNVTQAAKVLGIHRRSLQRKLAKHPLPR